MKTLATILLAVCAALTLGCGYSKHTTPPMAGTAPTINANGGLNPTSATAGVAVMPLTVNGTLFASNAVVNFNGVKYTPTTMTSTVLTVTIPGSATMGMTSGTVVQVTVTNPGTPGNPGYGGGTSPATSNMVPFTIN